ncbi:MAG: Nramp family divalent metal transporter, partial [Lewinella sp.]
AKQPINKPPRRWVSRLAGLGPGITWMAAGAGGAGELLLPPRIGSLYGYTFLWAVVLAVLLKWFMTREVGRYATCTGTSLMKGFRDLSGPSNWAVWVIIIPQVVVAISSVAGLASSAATAVILFLPGSVELWTAVIVILTAAFLLIGAYATLEKVATILAIVLAVAAIVSASTVLPGGAEMMAGLVPQLPPETDFQEVLPWLSFMLAGAAGMVWYSYWLTAGEFGLNLEVNDANTLPDPERWSDAQIDKLRSWLKEMNLDLGLGVLGGFLIVLAFLILGAELLRPAGIVPERDEVASTLGWLLGDVWGQAGYWIMIVGVLVGFTATVLTNQDGWGRLLADGTVIVGKPLGLKGQLADRNFLRKLFLGILLTLGPIGVFLWLGEPVLLVQIAGIVEAVHIPFIIALTLYLNRTRLPKPLQPNAVSVAGSALAGLFFVGFAALFILQKVGWVTL